MRASSHILASLLVIASSSAMAATVCSKVQLKTEEPHFKVSAAQLQRSSLYKSFAKLLKNRPDLKTYITEPILAEATDIMSMIDQPLYQSRLKTFVAVFKKDPTAKIDRALQAVIGNLMTSANAEKRIEQFKAGKISLKKALGEMSVEEVYQNTVGKDVHHIASDSLLGRYLKEAAAVKGKKIDRSFRTFITGPNKKTRGPERLVVAVDAATFPIFKKYFLQDQSIVHYHTEQQGTLHLSFEGIDYNWFGSEGDISRSIYNNTIMPPILLSTNEAQRASLFFELMVANNNLARHPWKLAKQREDGQFDQFCAIGGYSSCTHWFGNIPLGDERVSEYMLPGKVDEHASISLYPGNAKKDAAPRVQELNSYDSIYSRDYGFEKLPANIKNLVKSVWQENQSHMQLWEVMGIKRQQAQGELANPGYVAFVELSGFSNVRIPVVFVMQEDATESVRQDLTSTIHAY